MKGLYLGSISHGIVSYSSCTYATETYFLTAIETDPKPFMLKTFSLFLKIVRGQPGRAQEFLEKYYRTKDTYKPPPHYYRKLSFDNDLSKLISDSHSKSSKGISISNPTSPPKKQHPSRSFSF